MCNVEHVRAVLNPWLLALIPISGVFTIAESNKTGSHIRRPKTRAIRNLNEGGGQGGPQFWEFPKGTTIRLRLHCC